MNAKKEFDLEEIIVFMKAVHKACEDKETDKEYTFICPICGGEAQAFKSVYNGHRRGQCEQCNMNMTE